MNRADLLAKIKKCLALAKGATEHEAAAALAKARELMDLYGVDEAEVALADVGEATSAGTRSERPPMWELVLIGSVSRAIPTKPLLGYDGVTFVGLAPAPEIAAYAFTVLFRQIKKARAEYIRTQLKRCSLSRKRKRADLFCEGWAGAVYRQVARLNPAPELDALVQRYLNDRYNSLVSVEGRSAGLGGRVALDDRARGRAAGADAQIHQGVGAGRPQALLGGGR